MLYLYSLLNWSTSVVGAFVIIWYSLSLFGRLGLQWFNFFWDWGYHWLKKNLYFYVCSPTGGKCGSKTVAVASGEAKLNSYSLYYRKIREQCQQSKSQEQSQGPEASHIGYSQPGTKRNHQPVSVETQPCCPSCPALLKTQNKMLWEINFAFSSVIYNTQFILNLHQFIIKD